jgi:hypothetical protein
VPLSSISERWRAALCWGSRYQPVPPRLLAPPSCSRRSELARLCSPGQHARRHVVVGPVIDGAGWATHEQRMVLQPVVTVASTSVTVTATNSLTWA